MPALAGEACVELDAEVDELRDALRRLARKEVDRALAAEPAPGGEGVRRVQRGIVVGADRGRDAALRRPAVRGVDRALREDCDGRAGVRGSQRSREAGDPRAHDCHVVVQFLPQRR